MYNNMKHTWQFFSNSLWKFVTSAKIVLLDLLSIQALYEINKRFIWSCDIFVISPELIFFFISISSTGLYKKKIKNSQNILKLLKC